MLRWLKLNWWLFACFAFVSAMIVLTVSIKQHDRAQRDADIYKKGYEDGFYDGYWKSQGEHGVY